MAKKTDVPVRHSAILLFLVSILLLVCSGTGESAAEPVSPVAVDEHIGAKIPLDALFYDETGKTVRLAELITGPTIILPVYYSCTNVCAYQQGRMAGALQALKHKPLEEYRVISISFDETDTPERAAKSKRTYLTAMKNDFPPDGWRFLVGNRENIKRFTDAIGYGFKREKNDFMHPVATVVVSGDGTIIRYLYGIAALPKDLALAITEAQSGVTGASVRKLMEYCFSFDPETKTYTFNLLRVSATVVILCAGSFLLFLARTGKKRQKKIPGKK